MPAINFLFGHVAIVETVEHLMQVASNALILQTSKTGCTGLQCRDTLWKSSILAMVAADVVKALFRKTVTTADEDFHACISHQH
jgi:hypothetical protein